MSNPSLYADLPNLIIGFHGCDQKTLEKVVFKGETLKPSVNPYDWLGNGVYFWEQNLERAWKWAKDSVKFSKKTKGEINEPAVIGAVIDLGYCLNLLDNNCIELLRDQYELFKLGMEIAGKEMPVNTEYRRNLDCAVIESLHRQRIENDDIPFDSVRGVFIEGKEIYPTSGFMKNSHIQICIRNPNCIKGYFVPREVNDKYRII